MKKQNVLIGLIVFAAFCLRAAGAGFGPYHADEPIVVNHALLYATGDLNPHFFKIPPLVSYLCFGVYGAWFAIGKLLGVFESAQAFEQLFVHHPEIFYHVGRVAVGVIPGVFTVWAVWAGVRRMASERAAMWAAAAMAFNFLHVRDSHAIYADILMTLLAWWAVAAALEFLKKPGVREAGWAGILVGAATAAKYNALLVGAAVLLAWCLASRKITTAAAVLCGAALAFVCLNPFAVLDWGTFWREVASQATAEGPVAFRHLTGYSLAESCGWGVLIVGVVGAVHALVQDRKAQSVFFVFPIIFFLKLLLFSQPHERYVMPLLPFIAAAFGWGVHAILAGAERRGHRVALTTGVLAVTLLFGAVKSVWADVLFLRPDTRDLARAWIQQNIESGSGIGFTDPRLRPFVRRDRRQWDENPSRIDVNRKTRMEYEASDSQGYALYFVAERPLAGFAGVWPSVASSVDDLKRAGVRYVVLHQGSEAPPVWREELKSRAHLLRRFTPYHDAARERPLESWSVTFAAYAWEELSSRERFGPVLEIYEL